MLRARGAEAVARWSALGVVVLAVTGVWLTGAHGQVPPDPDQLPEPAADGPAGGRELYLRDCAICHGVRGSGSDRGPDITEVGRGGVDFMLRTGRMPIFRPDDPVGRSTPEYSDDEIALLLDHVDAFVDGPPEPEAGLPDDVDVAAGGERYRLACAACHQMAGQGGALAYGEVAPSLGETDPVETIEALRLGPGNMPVFDESVIDDREAREIAAYVEELQDPDDRGGWDIGHFGPVPEGAVAFVFGVVPALLIARSLGQRGGPEEAT